MDAPLIIIGSGFAAYQLVKTLRRRHYSLPIQVFTADNGDEYNKPDLSHVFTRQQSADDLISVSGEQFASQQQVALFANTLVDDIDAQAHTIIANGKQYQYSKLVLATGAKTFIPKLSGDASDEVITLNSLSEYRSAQTRIAQAEQILIMGGGLIGTELAMDLASSGKKVRVLEPSVHIMGSLMPDFVATVLEKQLRGEGVQIDVMDYVTGLARSEQQLIATTYKGMKYPVDCVISAAGLVPNTELATKAGAKVQRGIVVDKQLNTTLPDIYAIGDCAEIDGKIMAFLQPIILSVNTLASQILLEQAVLTLPPSMVKVKTPSYPIQLAGRYDNSSQWQMSFSQQGLIAKAYDEQQQLTGFIVTKEKVNQAFPLLREIQTASNHTR